MVDFKLFSLVAAVARKVSQAESVIGGLIDNMNPVAIYDLGRAKNLFAMYVQGKQRGVISIDELAMELQLGAFSRERQANILGKLREAGLHELSMIDYLAYCPLFLHIHDSVVDTPFAHQ